MIRALALFLFSVGASAQTLQPVTAPASTVMPWWLWPAIAIVIVAAGFVWLKVKKPTTAAAVQTTISNDAETLVKLFAEAMARTKANPPADPTVVAVAAPDLQPALDAANGKLAQIKAIVDA